MALSAALTLSACGSADDNAAETTPAPGSEQTQSAQPQATETPSTQAPADAADCPPADGTGERVTEFSSPPPMCIDPGKNYTAKIATDAGEFTVALDAQKAPGTVNNFVFLARNHFYDTTPFHRVIQGFMAQGGDPEGTGMGGPGYTIEDELPQSPYQVGSVAMANSGTPNSGGSQFFIVTGPDGEGLPREYALFGQVTEGMDVVQKIEADGTEGEGTPKVTHTIETVTITEK